MNISKKSTKNYILLFLKLFPLAYLLMAVLHNSLSLETFNSYWCSFGLTENIVNYFESVNINMSVLGVTMIGYFNYLIMFHLLECLFEVLVFIPELFLYMLDKIKGVDY